MVIGVLGIGAGYLFYRRGRQIKLPYYAVNHINLVEDLTSRLDGLSVGYKGSPVETLSVTKVALWNGGNETINGEDVSGGDPLTVGVTGEARLLDAKVVSESSLATQFHITPMPNGMRVTIGFDYLDHNDGAVVQLVHTGTSDREVQVTGSIKGAGRPKERKDRPPWLRLTLLFIGVLAADVTLVAISGGAQWVGWAAMGTGLLLGIGLGVITISTPPRVPPRDLKGFWGRSLSRPATSSEPDST